MRWLTKKGRHDEAWESLKWIRADESQSTVEEMEEIRMGVEMERRATEGLKVKGTIISHLTLFSKFQLPKLTYAL